MGTKPNALFTLLLVAFFLVIAFSSEEDNNSASKSSNNKEEEKKEAESQKEALKISNWYSSIQNFSNENFNWLINESGGYLQIREEVKISGTSVKAANIIRFYPNGKLIYGVCPIDYTPDSYIPSSEDCRKGTWSITQSWEGSPYTASSYGLDGDASYFLIDLDLAAGYRVNELVNKKKTKALVYDLSKKGILYMDDVMESPILNKKSHYADDDKSTFDMLVEGAFIVPFESITSTPFMTFGETTFNFEQTGYDGTKEDDTDIYEDEYLDRDGSEGIESYGDWKMQESFYIINIAAVKSATEAEEKVKGLINSGYQASYLWIPDYNSLSKAEYYSVYIGPFQTQRECEEQVESYRQINANAYGLLVSQENKRVTITGVNKVQIKEPYH